MSQAEMTAPPPAILTVPPPRPTPGRMIVVAAAFVVVAAGIKAAEAIVVPLLFAAFVAILVTPILGVMTRRGVPTWLAYLIAAAMVVIVGVLVLFMAGASVSDFLGRLPEYRSRLRVTVDNWLVQLKQFGIDLEPQVRAYALDSDSLMAFAGRLAGGMASAFANGFLILVTAIFLIAEAAVFPAKLRALPGDAEASLARLREVVEGVRRYVAIKAWLSLITAALVVPWLWLLGVKYAMLWGLLAFLLNFVPNIGSIIAALPPVLVAVLERGAGVAGLVVVGYLAVNNFVGYVIEPRWMGHGLGLSPLSVLLSLIFWGWLLGAPGMLLSVPLTMVVKIALACSPETRWMAGLLGEPPPDPGSVASSRT